MAGIASKLNAKIIEKNKKRTIVFCFLKQKRSLNFKNKEKIK
jgi:hypothetical protein